MAVLFFIISFFSSIIGAISGIGGGIIIKPVLDAATTLDVGTISFLSGCTVLSMSSVSLFLKRKDNETLDIKSSTFLSIGGIIGGITGKYIFNIIKKTFENDAILSVVQTAILLLMTVGVLVYILNSSRIIAKFIRNNLMKLLIGIILGLISAFLGIGGGPMNIAILYYFFSMDAKAAALNSIYIIFFSQLASLITTIVQQKVPQVDLIVLSLMVVGGITGAILGSWISAKISIKHVERVFIALLLVVAGINIFNLFKFSLLV